MVTSMLHVIQIVIELGLYSLIPSLIITLGLGLIKKEWFPSFRDRFLGVYFLFIGIYSIFSKKINNTTSDFSKIGSHKFFGIDVTWSFSIDKINLFFLFLSSILLMLGSMFLFKKHPIRFSWKIVFGIFLVLLGIIIMKMYLTETI